MLHKQTFPAFGIIPFLLGWLGLTVLVMTLSFSSCRKQPRLVWPITPSTSIDLSQYEDVSKNIGRLEQITSKANQLDSLLIWTEWLRNSNDSLAFLYAEAAYERSTKNRYEKAQAVSAYYMALLPGRQALYNESIEISLLRAGISRRIFMRGQDLAWKIKINNLLGNLWYRNQVSGATNLDSANYYLKTALELAETDQQDQVIEALRGEVYHNLWSVQIKQKNTSQAQESFQQAYQLYENSKHQFAQDRLILDAAQYYSKIDSFDLADSLFQVSITSAQSRKNGKQHLAKTYQRFGSMRFKEYRKEGKEEDFNDILEYAKAGLDYQADNHYYNYALIGKAFQSRAGENPDYIDSALVYYREAFLNARKESAISFFKNISLDITNLCNYRLKYYGRSCNDILSMDDINSNYIGIVNEITASLQESSADFLAFEEGEMEMAVQRRVRNIWLLVGIGMLIAGFIFVVIYFRQQQQRLRAQMQALRAQINPHFISNSLNAIESLVNLDQREAAAKYLIHFSRLTRRILNGSMAPFTSLSGELDTLKHFLALEQLRFRNKLQYQINLPTDLEADIIQVPSMILQPYIENAIWHGIKPKKDVGFLEISVAREGKNLVCIVEDDGVGRVKAMELKAKTVLQHKSVGMKITKQRLEAISRYKGGRVVIEDLYHDDGEAAGTRVIIRFPYKTIKSKKKVS